MLRHKVTKYVHDDTKQTMTQSATLSSITKFCFHKTNLPNSGKPQSVTNHNGSGSFWRSDATVLCYLNKSGASTLHSWYSSGWYCLNAIRQSKLTV